MVYWSIMKYDRSYMKRVKAKEENITDIVASIDLVPVDWEECLRIMRLKNDDRRK